MQSKKIAELEAIKWQRETSALGAVLARSITRTLLNVDSGYNALDLACGDGLLTREIRKRFLRVVGVDASRHHIEVAQRRVPGVEFHVSLIEDFDRRGELFNTIYMIGILEHLENPVETLAQVRGWLSRDGLLVIYVPNALSLNRVIGQKMGIIHSCYDLTEQDILVGHKRFYDLESLTRDVTDSGLTVRETGGTLLKPFSNVQMEWFMEGWGREDKDKGWQEKLCVALCELGSELPQYANSIWMKCSNG